MSFSQTAMLVSLNVRCYSARKEDKKISAEVAAQHNAKDAGRYQKDLVAKSAIDPVVKAGNAMRMFHYENTLPWMDDGVRILPAANFQAYQMAMEGLKDSYESAVRDFVTKWPDIIEDARQRLNGMFNPRDYPVNVEDRFGVRVKFMPIPDSADFRVAISDMERETLRNQISESLSEASRDAMKELWDRVATSVQAMAGKLAAYKRDDTGKTENPFRDSLVENLRDLCGLLPRLNFTGDLALESVRLRIEKELLADRTAEDFRESELLRSSTAKKAEQIAFDIAEFMK